EVLMPWLGIIRVTLCATNSLSTCMSWEVLRAIPLSLEHKMISTSPHRTHEQCRVTDNPYFVPPPLRGILPKRVTIRASRRINHDHPRKLAASRSLFKVRNQVEHTRSREAKLSRDSA